jgi:HAD superfamily hydrolase (TIGR01549 family)
VRSDDGYQVLLIDLDGTVVDYARTEADALAKVHAEFFSRSATFREFAAEFHAGNGALWEAYRRGDLDLDDLRAERFAQLLRRMATTASLSAVVARFEAELGRCVTMFPEAWSALRSLRRLARLVLVTDGISAVQHAKLSRCRLRRFFDRVVISSEVGYRKPQPALLYRALDQAGANPRGALVVGDSGPSDGAGAYAAGLDFCWVNRTDQPQHAAGPVPARFQVPDLRALAALLTERQATARQATERRGTERQATERQATERQVPVRQIPGGRAPAPRVLV